AARSPARTSLRAAGERSTRARRARWTTLSARCGSSWRRTRRSRGTSSPCAGTATDSRGDDLKFLPTELSGVLLVEPDVFRDARGFFLETFHARKYREAGISGDFVQDNHSRSGKGTLRGLHAQLKKPQGKLVRAVRGEIFDVG